ncbi:MAG: HalOD1 output domain-containing protein [Halalkalicoccus sp.]
MTDEGESGRDTVVTEGEPVVHRTEHDFDGRRELTTTIIEAIEETADVDGPSSRVLADVIDPDALDGLFRPVRHRTDRKHGKVQFPLDSYRITVYATGEIELRQIRDRGGKAEGGD